MRLWRSASNRKTWRGSASAVRQVGARGTVADSMTPPFGRRGAGLVIARRQAARDARRSPSSWSLSPSWSPCCSAPLGHEALYVLCIPSFHLFATRSCSMVLSVGGICDRATPASTASRRHAGNPPSPVAAVRRCPDGIADPFPCGGPRTDLLRRARDAPADGLMMSFRMVILALVLVLVFIAMRRTARRPDSRAHASDRGPRGNRT
jgi:hypothetical protein